MTDIPIIRGEFEVIDNRLHIEPRPIRTDAMARIHRALVEAMNRLDVPQLPTQPEPEDFEAVADYIQRVTLIFDVTWLQDIGAEVASNALCRIDQSMFCGQFVGAIDGNATFELDSAAQAAREAQEHAEDEEADRRWDDQHVEF
jgi:hypothetical protein